MAIWSSFCGPHLLWDEHFVNLGCWQSGRFWHQRSTVWILLSAKFTLNIVHCKLYWIDENKEKRGREWPIFIKTFRQFYGNKKTFLKIGQSRPLLFIFVFIAWLNSNLNWEKHWWCDLDLNPRRQNGRRRWIHWAMAVLPGNKNTYVNRMFWSTGPSVRFLPVWKVH